ncbi:hypothetical protein [Mycobacteroides abscessus]|uniref:hypothetical protein n=1 Tax=Mycobacteroides abscessus TaxID=36809 RepID=UPI00025882B4|nr:hypothetical protein [Mycobacteroides abscessus]EIC62277.1 hypothetical protein S7W_24131 [Mycobacteroides abscessus M94]SKZ50557.1 Uncharacterised protein [Mycobacteroides abscessus subsp. abscessus]
MYTALTAAPRHLYVLTVSGDVHRVHALAVTREGDIEPVVTTPTAWAVRHPVHMGTWLSCHIARVRGAHIPKPEPEPEHLDEVTDARGPVPAAIKPLSVVPNHRRPRERKLI